MITRRGEDLRPTANQRRVYCCKPLGEDRYCWRRLAKGKCTTHGLRKVVHRVGKS